MLIAFSGFRSTAATLVRLPGPAYFLDGAQQDSVRNQFILRILNKRAEQESVRIEIAGAPSTLAVSGVAEAVTVPPLGEANLPLVLRLPRNGVQGELPLKVRIVGASGKLLTEKKLTFLAPLDHAP